MYKLFIYLTFLIVPLTSLSKTLGDYDGYQSKYENTYTSTFYQKCAHGKFFYESSNFDACQKALRDIKDEFTAFRWLKFGINAQACYYSNGPKTVPNMPLYEEIRIYDSYYDSKNIDKDLAMPYVYAKMISLVYPIPYTCL